jgi:hypothetical protein
MAQKYKYQSSTELLWKSESFYIYLPVAGSCEHGNEPSISTKGGEFLF